jgi:protocatechuate 3,4-dioxygenase beta subunit
MLGVAGDEFLFDFIGSQVKIKDSNVENATLEVERGATIVGRVEPANKADVSIVMDPMRGIQAFMLQGGSQSKSDGTFTLGPVRAGTMTLEAKTSDGHSGQTEVSVPAEGLENVVIRLEENGSLAGTVVDASGAPVSNVRVELRSSANSRSQIIVNGRDMTAKSAHTGSNGEFMIKGVEAGEYGLTVVDAQQQLLSWARAKDKRRPLPQTFVERENKVGLVLRVEERDAVLRGVAIGPDGGVASDVWITATPAAQPSPGLPSRLGRSGDASKEESSETEERTESRNEMVMVMMTDDGEGPGLDLGAIGSLPPTLTDDQGRFEFRGLRSGKYDLVAEGMKGRARGFLNNAETDRAVQVKMMSLTRIEGRVTLDGAAVKHFRVGLKGHSRFPKQVRNESGEFTMHRVDPGSYTVHVQSDQGEATAEVEVVEGQSANVEIQLEGFVRVRGTVLNSQGKPLAGAVLLPTEPQEPGNVSIQISDDSNTTRSDGTFDLGVRPGEYTLTVVSPATGEMAQMPLKVAQGSDTVDLGDITTSARNH